MLPQDEFFAGQPLARQIFEAVRAAVDAAGPAQLRASKSQLAFWRRRPFAAVWRPGQYLRGPAAPLVLTLFLRRRIDSPRWKEVVEPAPGRFTHHLELFDPAGVDDEVRDWLRLAYAGAE